MNNEIWTFVDYPNYSVSSMGRVKRNDSYNSIGSHMSEKILSQTTDRLGYKRVSLRKNGVTKHHLVHRLVASAFIPNPNNLSEVNHKDEDKTNNNVYNLEWCTHKYNSNYGTRVQRIIPKTIAKTRKKVCQYTLTGTLIKVWDGVNIAAKELGIAQQNITKCYQHKRNQAGGYKWELYREGDGLDG